MRVSKLLPILPACVLLAQAALAKDETKAVLSGNQAVSADKDGKRKVAYPPNMVNTRDMGASKPTEAPGIADGRRQYAGIKVLGPNGESFYMIEGPRELLECTLITVADSHCRPSTFGKVVWSRIWVVQVKGAWYECQRRNTELPGDVIKGYVCEPRGGGKQSTAPQTAEAMIERARSIQFE
jgi:hypothetical protein